MTEINNHPAHFKQAPLNTSPTFKTPSWNKFFSSFKEISSSEKNKIAHCFIEFISRDIQKIMKRRLENIKKQKRRS